MRLTWEILHVKLFSMKDFLYIYDANVYDFGWISNIFFWEKMLSKVYPFCITMTLPNFIFSCPNMRWLLARFIWRKTKTDMKLDGVALLITDHQPTSFTTTIFFFYMWHLTCDTWHLTHDTWHMIHDTSHMTHDTQGVVNIV